MIMGYRSNVFQGIDYFTLKIEAGHIQDVLAHATKVHNMFDENTAIEYHFLDQQWAEFYKNDQRAGNIFMIGAGITILIACLGLIGLASFIVQKRTKEIGVRKVLGASIPQLFVLLSKTFVVQVGIAFLIAVPISWYFMSEWLSTFAFKFGLGAGEFLLAGAMALIIALGSVSYRVVKATMLNPALTLKDE
jgi:putative ABC transport system permease protein